jgi:hypothetical protein
VIKNFKYFVYGVPPNQNDPLYALYQPILDRFLIVSHDLNSIKTLSAILLTRYPTYICCVSSASNYEHNIVDNEVCDSWTFSNNADLNVEYFLSNQDVVQVKNLVPTSNTVSWDIIKEKEWILFCQHWIEFFNVLKIYIFQYYQIDSILSDILPNDNLIYYPHDVERQVLNILFFGNDIEKTQLEIFKTIDANIVMSRFRKKYKQWQ